MKLEKSNQIVLKTGVESSSALKNSLNNSGSNALDKSGSQPGYPNEEGLQYQPIQIEGQCTLVSIRPIIFVTWRFVIYVILCILLIGIPLLLTFWYPVLKRYFYYAFCEDQECSHYLVKNHDESYSICEKLKLNHYSTEVDFQQTIYFQNRYLNYGVKQKKVKVGIFNFQQRIKNIFANKSLIGLNETQVLNLKQSYGLGTMIINKPTILFLLVTEVFRPLYLFLIFSCSLWVSQAYYYYSGVIFFTSVVAIIISLVQVNSLNQKIFEMAYYQANMNVLRNDQVVSVSSVQLVPGDIVFIKKAQKIPFDGILMEGSALINQCALTGQSVPIVKKAVPPGQFGKNKDSDKGSFVFEGTTIVQVNDKKPIQKFQQFRANYGLPVVVIRTNFVTLKGQLIRLISFPKERQNKFQKQSTKFLIVLFCLSVATYIFLIIKLHTIVQGIDLFRKFLDLITITVPPGLPISMTVGIVFALEKMKKKQIFCISPDKVIVGGSVNYICFDKTGTLTEDYMDFNSIVPSHGSVFGAPIDSQSKKQVGIQQIIKKNNILDIFGNMAANHSVIQLQDTGELIGDPMQINLLDFGEIKFAQAQSQDVSILYSMECGKDLKFRIYRRFEFDADLQRMGVIASINDNKQFHSYVKGSPEMIKKIVNPSSLPKDYDQTLKKYASNGLRVLAVASKKMMVQKQSIKTLSREQIEKGIEFNGFQVFENKLKPETSAAIQQLFQAQIPVVMITGDNALTGSNIAYKCGIANLGKQMKIIGLSSQGKLTEEEFHFQNVESAQSNNRRAKQQVIKNQRIYDVEFSDSSKHNMKNSINPIVQQNQSDLTKLVNKIMSQGQEKFKKTQFCLTGAAFNFLFPGEIENLSTEEQRFFSAIRVFARAKPNDKARIVMVYQKLGKITAMCGDGANDCGALKQADIGLSLSQAQASISSPFTSKVANIGSMVELLKECRAGLATNFSLFNIMALYSLTQYTTTVLTQYFFSYPADFQYLYWDIACNFFFFLTIGYTATADKLCVDKPSNSLFVLSNIAQVIIMAIIQAVGQVSVLLAFGGAFAEDTGYYSKGGLEFNQARYNQQLDFLLDTPDASAVFLFANFMYIYSLIAFDISRPWRKYFFTNLPFMLILLVFYTYSVLLVMVPEARLEILTVINMDNLQFNGFILGLANAFGIFMYLNQKLILENIFGYLKRSYPQKKWL